MRIVDEQTFQARLSALESWLWSAGAVLLQHPLPTLDVLVARVEELSDAYTVDRADMAQLARRGGHLVPRLLYFLCSDAPKVHLVLRELVERHGDDCLDGRSMVDLGCGVGASAAGLLLSIDGPSTAPLRLLGVDLDPAVLPVWTSVARRCAELADASVELATREAGLTEFDTEADTSILLAQAVLNECLVGGVGAEADLVRRIGRWAARHPCLLLEPALRVATRPLHALRDAVLAGGGVRVLAPCPHQGPCPMLRNPRDWCHEVRIWPPTPQVALVQTRTRRRDDRLKFSFAALAPSAVASVSDGTNEPHSALRARLVSDPLASKGKVERFACTSEGSLRRLRLLDRERTDGNRALCEPRRGVLVELDGLGDGERVGPQVRVRACPGAP